MGLGLQVKPEEDFFSIGQVADKAAERKREIFDQGWGADDLFLPGAGGLLVNVHDFEGVPARQMLFAKVFEIKDSPGGPGSGAGDIKPKDILLQGPPPFQAPLERF